MIEEKNIRRAKKRVLQYVNEGIIIKGTKNNMNFFIKNSKNSLDTAKVLFSLSNENSKQKEMGFTNFDGYLWVINASYYSMFYLVRALLEKDGIKIRTDSSIHSITFDALIYYFYINEKLQKNLIEDFINAKEESAEILGKQKADELIEDYFFEKKKRASFTYDMGSKIVASKAKTSLERAQKFNLEIRKVLE